MQRSFQFVGVLSQAQEQLQPHQHEDSSTRQSNGRLDRDGFKETGNADDEEQNQRHFDDGVPQGNHRPGVSMPPPSCQLSLIHI